MKKAILILSAFACISNAAAQPRLRLPDKSAVIDTEIRAQCQQTVERIDNSVWMKLKCDTLQFRTDGYGCDEFTGIYIEEYEGRLRKYYRKESCNDGAGTYITFSAYYNRNGELVYLYCYTSSNCDDGEEWYYVHKGKIIDFAFYHDCSCCEESDEHEAYINSIRPVVGEDLKETIGWRLSLKNFIHADTLLAILKSEKYSGYGEEW